jgi:hypothetical protein
MVAIWRKLLKPHVQVSPDGLFSARTSPGFRIPVASRPIIARSHEPTTELNQRIAFGATNRRELATQSESIFSASRSSRTKSKNVAMRGAWTEGNGLQRTLKECCRYATLSQKMSKSS